MKTVANELEKNWLSIVDQNICILIHKIMIGNEQEKVYTKFVSATITSNCNSNGLSSREANAICIVLGEISPLLQ